MYSELSGKRPQNPGPLYLLRTFKVPWGPAPHSDVLILESWFQALDSSLKRKRQDFPGGPVPKNSRAAAGDVGFMPALGRPHMSQGNEARVPQLLSSGSRAGSPDERKPTHSAKTQHSQSQSDQQNKSIKCFKNEKPKIFIFPSF